MGQAIVFLLPSAPQQRRRQKTIVCATQAVNQYVQANSWTPHYYPLGYPDTTQDADLFVEKTPESCERIAAGLRELGFDLSDHQAQEILRGNFVQLKNGPFDLDLIFAPDGIERFEGAWGRRVDVQGFPVCDVDDIIRSKQATNRRKDRETLPRLLKFRDWLRKQR